MKKWFKWLMEGPETTEHLEREIVEARGLADMVARDLDAQTTIKTTLYAAFLKTSDEMRAKDIAIETRMAQIEIDYQGLHARLINMEMEATEMARARADNEQLKGALAEAKGPQRVKSFKALRDVMAANEEGEL